VIRHFGSYVSVLDIVLVFVGGWGAAPSHVFLYGQRPQEHLARILASSLTQCELRRRLLIGKWQFAEGCIFLLGLQLCGQLVQA
jgi:hypothetical protein